MKALIIGFGSMGKKHFLALKSLDIEVAVLSQSAEQLKDLKIYRSFDTINLNAFELFIIANPTSEHFHTLKKLDSLLKDKTILVEKPLFQSDKKFQSQNNSIFIAYLLRFHPVIQTLKELLVKEEPYFATLECDSYLPHWRSGDYRQNYSAKKESGGGVLLDLSHEIDLAFFLFGDLNLNFSQNTKISELEITSDDFAFLALQDKKNTKIHIRLNYFSKFNKREIIIHSPQKSFRADLILNKIEIHHANKEVEILNFENDTIKTLKNLYQGLFKKDKNLCTLEEARKILKICDGAKNV